jgi:hypothetical protein
MKVKSMLRFGAVTVLLVMLLLPLMAFETYSSTPISNNAESERVAEAPADDAVYVTANLGPEILTATYKGHSGCAATQHDFEIAVDVLDATNNIYRVRNLLDEGQVLKARLKDGKLDMGRQKMGSYVVTGAIEYKESPARLETRVKYEDGIGFCDDVSVFVKR